MSILLPSLSKAKDLAKKVSCQSNLKQIGLAFHYYAFDNDGKVPWCINSAWSVPTWQNDLAEYLEATEQSAPIFQCPNMGEERFTRPSYAQGQLNGWYIEYGMNMHLSHPASGWAAEKVSQLGDCHDKVLVGDGARHLPSGAVNWFIGMLEANQIQYPLGERHLDGSNIVYGGGHVEWSHADDFDDLKW